MKATLRRRAVVRTLLAERGDLLVVAGLGSAAWDCTAAGDSALTFPLWGAMGVATMTGLGLALAQPKRRVLVITGDGEMLMGLGTLATVAVQRPGNLAIAVIDNERYGETGMQATHTAHGVDLAAVARGCGFGDARVVWRGSGLKAACRALRVGAGPVLVQFKVVAEKLPLSLPPREGALLKSRFRRALLGPGADTE
ncbi:MAG: aldehyde dehydrogenase [Betaproteobacteria bacterium RIFCSPLOWO2_02_67_12]|nr:MAG: aldehyde dehydrogenase [Betaproteobacteria bacterium RIFCSPLOWO2_02_67_12]OGA59842.1 MAG: aldehyde dehydrogenase [Betaproteobacteria bacterium RIFCSPLOWO2_12_FULL_67_28]